MGKYDDQPERPEKSERPEKKEKVEAPENPPQPGKDGYRYKSPQAPAKKNNADTPRTKEQHDGPDIASVPVRSPFKRY